MVSSSLIVVAILLATFAVASVASKFAPQDFLLNTSTFGRIAGDDFGRWGRTTTTTITTTTRTPTTTTTTTTTAITTITTSTLSLVKNGKYVDVDWSAFPNYPSAGDWGVLTGDDQYQYIAFVQGVPLNRVRDKTLVTLGNGIGGTSSGNTVGIKIDWLFGKNVISPNDPQSVASPSYGMTPATYSLQRLDSAYYHELAHNVPVACSAPCPSWFVEGLATWAQDAVTQPGAYTHVKAQMEDTFYHDVYVYSNPNVQYGYGPTSAFFYWLIDNYGISGFHNMVRQCFGWDYSHVWDSQSNMDSYGFVPWTGKTLSQLSQDFTNSVAAGYRINITRILGKVDWAAVNAVRSSSNVTACRYSVCTYVNPNNISGGFYINGQYVSDGGMFRFMTNTTADAIATNFTITPASVNGYAFDSWDASRTVYVANTHSASTTAAFGSGGWDGGCVGNLILNYVPGSSTTTTTTISSTTTTSISSTTTTTTTAICPGVTCPILCATCPLGYIGGGCSYFNTTSCVCVPPRTCVPDTTTTTTTTARDCIGPRCTR